jgi:hypothetical protein
MASCTVLADSHIQHGADGILSHEEDRFCFAGSHQLCPDKQGGTRFKNALFARKKVYSN